MFLCETARTAAKIRTNLSTHWGKATKRLDRLAPNLAHMCRFIWEWIYAKQIGSGDTRGHLGVLEGHRCIRLGKLSNGWTDWPRIWYTSADSSGNGQRLNTILPSITQGHFGGFHGVTNSKVRRSSQTAGPIGTKFGTHVHNSFRDGYTPNKLPFETQGGHLGV